MSYQVYKNRYENFSLDLDSLYNFIFVVVLAAYRISNLLRLSVITLNILNPIDFGRLRG